MARYRDEGYLQGLPAVFTPDEARALCADLERLRSYKVAESVYDATVVFCDRFVEKRSRTHDQMVQAARSGVRNISEGSGAAATSRKSEMKLTNVARASLNDELLKDYKSFLMQRGLRVWHKDSPEALAMRERLKHDIAPGLPPAPSGKVRLTGLAGLSDFVGKAEPELAANAMLCAVNQAAYLLKRQLESQGLEFLKKGGFTENLYASRVKQRESDESDRSDSSDTPTCPACGKPMRRRTAGKGPRAGQAFWGCSGFPDCRGTQELTDPSAPSDNSDTLPTATPAGFADARACRYRDDPASPMVLYVVAPAGGMASDRRPALVFFFGGGWTRGTPEDAMVWARAAAARGWVGIVPDYRTMDRFKTSPLASVADGRAALRWVQDHAAELGLDPAAIVVGGNSAGGHVALWTALPETPPGSSPAEAPHRPPAALVLISAVSDTSARTGYTPVRFGEHADALSPVHRLVGAMPPALVFHGDADETVPFRQSVALHERLVALGNPCELVTVPGGQHNFTLQGPHGPDWVTTRIWSFLHKQGFSA